jgi:predicted TIM-barrel fold metal-dependent hydrolase
LALAGNIAGVTIIDAHVHLYPSEASRAPLTWAEARKEPLWAALCTRKRKDGTPVQGFPAMSELLRDMNAAGIRKAVLLGWYWQNHATCVEHNKFYASCIKAYPGRFAAFATVHPGAGQAALDEVKRARDLGFCGLGELSPHSQGVSLDDPIWRKILTLAGELKMPVNLHVTDPDSKNYPGRVDTPLNDFLTLAEDFPATNFILAHWGGGLAWSKRAQALPNLWFDTAASPLLYGPEVWKKAPPGRVLFGSDYPLVLFPRKGPQPEFAGFVQSAETNGAEPATFRETTARLLGFADEED